MIDDTPRPVKPVRWVGSSRRDLKTFPRIIQRDVGQALYAAQLGEEYPSVKPLKGFGGRSVLEIVAAEIGATYRAVYTVRFADAIYVLHAFQKKSKKGISTPKKEMDLVRQRLAIAERAYRERQN
jgi:phage-related protein